MLHQPNISKVSSGDCYDNGGITVYNGRKKQKLNSPQSHFFIDSSSNAINIRESSMTLTDSETNNNMLVPLYYPTARNFDSIRDLKKLTDTSFIHKNNTNNGGNSTSFSGIGKHFSARVHTRKLLRRFRFRLVACMCARITLGLLISLLICVTIVSMTYFYRYNKK
jgi:hypothetical protein